MAAEVPFEIGETPVPAARPRVTARGHTYYPKRHATYKAFLDDLFKSFGAQKIEGPCEVRFLFAMPRYKSSDHPVRREDVDNLAKLPMDCMTTSEKFWTDDDLVSDLRCFKRFVREGEEPRTEVRVIPIEGSVEDHVDRAFYS